MLAAAQQKQCKRCACTKPSSEFYANPHMRDGLSNTCRICTLDEARVRGKQYREANAEKIAERRRAYRQANPDKVRAYKKAYNAAHPKVRTAEQKEYDKAYSREWRKNNPDKLAVRRIRRKQLLKGSDNSYINGDQWQSLCAAFDNRCLKCGQQGDLSPDHVIPISLHGPDHITNIQPLCWPCNKAKNNRIADYRDPEKLAAFLRSL